MNESAEEQYFLYDLQIPAVLWQGGDLSRRLLGTPEPPPGYALNVIAAAAEDRLDAPISAGILAMLSALNAALVLISRRYLREKGVRLLNGHIEIGMKRLGLEGASKVLKDFVTLYPPEAVVRGESDADRFFSGQEPPGRRTLVLAQLYTLAIQARNPALGAERRLLDDEPLQRQSGYRLILEKIDRLIGTEAARPPFDRPLSELLAMPLRHAPNDLAAQLDFVRRRWGHWLPEALLGRLLTALDRYSEERQMRGGAPGPAPVPEFGEQSAAEPRSYSRDADWMPNVVLMAKSVQVWLDQLSRQYGRELRRLDDIPEAELDRLVRWNVNALWLIGIWERSRASKRIKQIRGNPDAEASAYSLYDYVIAEGLGGEAALESLRERCERRGIRLACDMVPNHTGICSRWIIEHPDWYIQTDLPPYPGYRFSGPDLCERDGASTVIEDGYWDHSEAAVVFKHVDHSDGRERYIHHGNDGTHLPWNDTAQLDFLLPEVRAAVLEEIVAIARRFSIIRFDAAMTLTKKHFQRLWYPQPGGGAGVPSRADFWMSRQDFERAFPMEFWREVVDRIAAEAPDTLLLAEAFWLMEGFFVRTLGMHRVYNSAFMNMLKAEENDRYRTVIKNILEFDPEILKRFVNFMSNPDEETAVAQFGTCDKYFGVAILMITLPGLPMFAHGQVEGLHEKYGMEYPRAYWQETVDEGLLQHHERMLFPLLGRRRLFSEAEHFQLYDFSAGGTVNEDVFAFSNRCDDQFALVVYHNHHDRASGWIHLACARAEESGLERTTLGAALGLPDGDELWHFVDHCTGLEYLRSTRQLAGEGLYLELGPYQAHVFVDFKRVQAPEDGWWALWRQLDGRPAADLEGARRNLHYSRLHQAFRQALEALATPAELESAGLSDLLKELQAHTGRPAEAEGLPAEMRRDLERLPHRKPRLPSSFSPPLVLLHHLDLRLGLGGESFERLGLDAVVRNWLENREPPCPPDEAWRLVEMLCLLLQWLRRLEQQAPAAALRSLLDEERTRRFLGCNRYEGAMWFHKESMEEMFNAMEMAARLFYPEAGATALAAEIDEGREACRRSGYRLDKFRDLL